MTSIFHITEISNLPSIINEGRLLCDNQMDARKLTPTNIAHSHIKVRRKNTKVPCCKRGCLADYVPFYFAPRSPMLYAISNGFIEGYTNGQDEIIHLVVDAEKIDRNGLPYTFTDMHAVMIMCRFFTDLVHLDQIDWKLMRSRYWFDTNDYPDRKQRRQAEFLVYSQLEWNFIEEIGVRLERTSRQVREIIEQTKTTHIPDINVHREWYY